MHEKVTGRLNLRKILLLCQQHFLLLILFTIFIGGISFSIAKFAVIPQYTSNAQILVHQKNTAANSSSNQQAYTNQQADVQMINTYKDLIVSRAVLTKVAQNISKNNAKKVTVGHLQKEISVTSKANSQIFTVSVNDSSPVRAAAIANELTNIFIKRVKTLMHTNNVTVVSRPVQPDKPSYPNTKMFTVAGLVFGFFLGFLYIVISYVLKEQSEETETSIGKHTMRD